LDDRIEFVEPVGSANFDFNSFRLRLLGFGQLNMQDAVFKLRRHFGFIHYIRKREASHERTIRAFHPMKALASFFPLLLPLSLKSQHAFLERDLDVLFSEARKFGVM
jgi:hypothetical protein